MISNQISHPAYLESHFRQDQPFSDWPYEFAIITAFATTGETWTEKQNEAADQTLESELRGNVQWHKRLIGYSPTTRHAEPGWAVEMTLSDACDLGLRYLQDAIYFVSGDELRVILCVEPREWFLIGRFRERLQYGPVFTGISSSTECV